MKNENTKSREEREKKSKIFKNLMDDKFPIY